MIDHVELTYREKKVTATCRSTNASASGPAVPSNARWELTVDGVTRDGFAGGPDDTEESVKETVRAWLAVRDEEPSLRYLDYRIEPAPHPIPDSTDWAVSVKLWRATREAAVMHGFIYGQRIIDGEVPVASV